MHALLLILDTVFFLLVGAALLRAWMNGLRLRMTQQPGLFVMALTNWAVMPLRRVMPRAMAQSSIDWASLLTAVLLSLAYGLIWFAIVAGMGNSVASVLVRELQGWGIVPVVALKFLLRTALQGLTVLIIAQAILSWVQPQSPAMGVLSRLCGPLLRPLQRVIPLVGGVDLSPLVAVLLLQLGLYLLG